jgi:hypothetical protein
MQAFEDCLLAVGFKKVNTSLFEGGTKKVVLSNSAASVHSYTPNTKRLLSVTVCETLTELKEAI